MKFNFSFGKKSKTITQWAAISITLSLIVSGLHKCTGINENRIWDLIDVSQKELKKKKVTVPTELNDYIIKTPKLLERRIQRNVDNAIEDYEKEERRLYKPTYIEEKNDELVCYSEDCKKLAPPMRMCSSFVEGIDCPRKKEDE
jgi:hypothetical protein